MSTNVTLDRFKNNFLVLIDICQEMVEEGSENNVSDISPTAFRIIKIVASRLKPNFLIERFISKTHKYWDKIKQKDLSYFKGVGLDFLNFADDNGIDNVIPSEDKGIFTGLKVDHINSFSKILEGKYKDKNGNDVELFDDDKVQDVWKIMHSFVKQSVVYIHEQRQVVDGVPTKEYYSDINLTENIQTWNIKKLNDLYMSKPIPREL